MKNNNNKMIVLMGLWETFEILEARKVVWRLGHTWADISKKLITIYVDRQ